MTVDHEGTAETHHGFDFLPHLRLKAMNRAHRAYRLIRTEGAFVKTMSCIGQQFLAGGAENRDFAILPAIQFDHDLRDPFFTFDPAGDYTSHGIINSPGVSNVG
jgi:hypothetical protein